MNSILEPKSSKIEISEKQPSSHVEASTKQPSSPLLKKVSVPVITSIVLGAIIILMIIGGILYFSLKSDCEGDNCGNKDSNALRAKADLMSSTPTSRSRSRSSNSPRSHSSGTNNSSPDTSSEDLNAAICKTPQCIALAYQLHNWGNNTVNPCDDFYQFTCGKFAENVNGEGALNWKQKIGENLIEDYLEKLKNPEKKADMAMKRVLDQCKKDKANLKISDESLKEIVAEIRKIGKWPMLDGDDFKDADFNLNDYLEKMTTLQSNFGLFKIELTEFIRVSLDDYPPKVFPSAKNMVSHVLKIYGTTVNKAQFDKDYADVLAFSQKVPTGKVYSGLPVTFQTLKDQFKNIDFQRMLKKLIGEKKVEDKIQLEGKFGAKYQDKGVDQLIETTPPKTLANFLMVRMLIDGRNLIKSVPEAGCGKNVAQFLPRPVIGILTRNFFDKENLKKASEIVDEMRVAFEKMLQDSTWLHEDTKKSAVKKLETMRKLVGFSEETLDPEVIERKFEEQLNSTTADSYYTFRQKLRTLQMQLTLDEIEANTPLVTTPRFAAVNAFYSAKRNSMVLTVPILDDPAFDASFPKYAQIGAIGFIAGHEIGHAFDPRGSKFDENGNYRDWWTADDRNEFQNRSKCLVEKYESYDDPAIEKSLLNGTVTLGENIADLLGARVSWDIYKNVDVSKEERIVGFEDYSVDKLFFQILASKWCSSYTSNVAHHQKNDVHGVNNYRVNGVFSNMKQFAETFDCPVGSKMNPAKKCEMF